MRNRIFATLIAMVMLLSLVPAAMAATVEVTAVTGIGTAKGFGGDVTVAITLVDGEIAYVEMTGDGETAGIGGNIINEWPEAFVNANGIVDTYTGATFAQITRNGVLEAARLALQNAGVNPDEYVFEFVEGTADDVTLDADVVIVGAGGAGMTAAIAAADAGKSVIIRKASPPWAATPSSPPAA
jgi:fumarate reductase flavoprotein subunit